MYSRTSELAYYVVSRRDFFEFLQAVTKHISAINKSGEQDRTSEEWTMGTSEIQLNVVSQEELMGPELELLDCTRFEWRLRAPGQPISFVHLLLAPYRRSISINGVDKDHVDDLLNLVLGRISKFKLSNYQTSLYWLATSFPSTMAWLLGFASVAIFLMPRDAASKKVEPHIVLQFGGTLLGLAVVIYLFGRIARRITLAPGFWIVRDERPFYSKFANEISFIGFLISIAFGIASLFSGH